MPLDRVDQVHVPLDLVAPGRGVRVLEVGHEALGARVERVDDELAVGRPGDLDAAVGVVAARRQRPARRPRGSRASPRGSPTAAGAARARRSSSRRRGAEAGVQLAEERQRLVGEDLVGALRGRRGDLHAHGRLPRIEWSSRVIGWKIGRSRWAAIWIAQPGLAAAIASAPVASRFAALRAPSSAAALGLDEVVDAGRAAAQLPLGGLERAPGRGCRAAARAAASGRAWACARWQASW